MPFKREYNDIDVIIPRNEAKVFYEFFNEIGYRENKRFNSLYGDRRLIFINADNGIKLDVFFDRFEMSHKFDFKNRLNICSKTLPISDLLMTKLQIVNLNQKDISDILAIFLDHEFGNEPCQNIEDKYILKYTSNDWGIYRTFTVNLIKAMQYLPQLSIENDLKYKINGKILAFMREIEMGSKTIKWKIRSIIGERKRWYELVSDLY